MNFYKLSIEALIKGAKGQLQEEVTKLKDKSGTPIEVGPGNMDEVEDLFKTVGHAEALSNFIENLEKAMESSAEAEEDCPVTELFTTSKN